MHWGRKWYEVAEFEGPTRMNQDFIVNVAELSNLRGPEPKIVCPPERPSCFPLFCRLAVYVVGSRLKRCDIVNGVFVDVAPHLLAPSDAGIICYAEKLAGR